MNPTIYDVSRLSGVSTATISRAFSNPELVRESTRRKVFEAAEVLHYYPNAIARAMARQRTDKIAFLICKKRATILDEFYAGICEGSMRETNKSDYQLVISTAADWDMAPSTAQSKQIEGGDPGRRRQGRYGLGVSKPEHRRGPGEQPHSGTGSPLCGVR